MDLKRAFALLIVFLFTATGMAGASPQGSGVPAVINFNGILRDHNNQPLSGTIGLTFALYREPEGGAPLWTETQNVTAGDLGQYSVLLGVTSRDGLPIDLFSSGEPRWLGVQPQLEGAIEQPRVFLVSVPYALKAADAQTLGGKPLSAFVLSESKTGTSADISSSAKTNGPTSFAISGTGSTNTVPKWLDAIGTLGNSSIVEVDGLVGIGTATPTQALTVNGAVRVANNQVFGFESTTPGSNAGRFYADTSNNMIFETNSGFSSMLFQTTGGKVGIGTANATAKLEIDTNDSTAYASTFNGSSQSTAVAAQPFDTLFLTNPNSGATFNSILFTNRTSGVSAGRIGLIHDADRGGALSFMTRSSSDFDMHEQMRITNLGTVGIGVTNPSTKLQVGGTVTATGFAGNGSLLTNLPAATDVNCGAPCIANGEIVDAAVTTAKIADGAVTSAKILDGTITDADINVAAGISASKLSQAAKTRGITYLAGCDTCSILADTDDQKTIYFNTVGQMTISSVVCFADTGTPSINLQRDDGSAANVLSSNLTCNGTPTTTFVGGESTLNLGDKLDFVMVTAGGAAHRVTVSITAVLN